MDRQALAIAPLRVLAHFTPGHRVHEFLSAHAHVVDVHFCAADDDDTFYRELPVAEVLWHVLRPIDAADLERGRRLKLVHKLGAGVNTIDIAAATRLGIAVANMPGANAPSVAEGTVLLMLAALRRLPALDRATRGGTGWPTDPTLGETVRDIGSCVVGLVGYGNVARRVETMVTAMGARVRHTNSRGPAGNPNWRPLAELLAESDIVSLHVPLTEDTRGLLDDAALARMKPGSILVNTARGAIIDEAALVRALRDGRPAAAGLDVFATEPVDPRNPLLAMDNVVVSPHVTWYTADTMARYLTMAVDNCARLLEHRHPVHVVNEVNL